MSELTRYKVQFGAKMTELVPLGVEAETRRADDEYMCRSTEVRRLEADYAALEARNAALVEAITVSLEAFKRAKNADAEMDWDQAIQEADDNLEAALAANKEKP